ncbi:hypothetical protein [Pseudomonas sp. SMN5]|uniref:hypothetical protein n=1 Tax=Pseudomonas sp. SMN5 TaxID=3390198 RepID=UPI003F859101
MINILVLTHEVLAVCHHPVVHHNAKDQISRTLTRRSRLGTLHAPWTWTTRQ